MAAQHFSVRLRISRLYTGVFWLCFCEEEILTIPAKKKKDPPLHNSAHRVRFNLNELSLIDPIRHSRWAFIRKALSGSATWALMAQEIHIKEVFEVKQLRQHRKPKSGL